MPYLLDTDTCIYIKNQRSPAVLGRLKARTYDELGMSVITWLELTYGAYRSTRVSENLSALERLRAEVQVLPLELVQAGVYGRVRAELEKAGTPIGPLDTVIAAHALSLDFTLVTNNTREFRRIKGLKVENWAE